MAYRKYRLGDYDEMVANHRWEVPRRYNIAVDVCDKHPRDRLAMVWESWRGEERKVSFGELQELSNRFANVLEAHGVERGDRVATLLPSLPETAAVFLGTYKRGAILLSLSILYGDEGIEFCHDVREGELFHGSGEWAWAAGICPLLGPWRYGAVQFVYARKGGFDPEEQLHQLSKHGVQNMFTTPTALRATTAVKDAGRRYPQQLRITCSAGEPLNPEVIRWFREQFGITVLDYYGLTESYPLCGNYPTVEVREGSMGRPIPGWDVAILDEDERPLPAGERGEICLRARSNPHYPLGYWNRPEDTDDVFGGEWFHTKDAAPADEDGYFWYAGRADDVIISAGYRIGPFEVESACVEHPAVLEAAAVASPDQKRGNIVKAFIVLAEGHDPTDETAEEIKLFVRERHSAYAYPREVEFVADLPKTLTGKIRRIELREAEREKKGAHAPA